MTTLLDLRTYVARDLRDTGFDTWSESEVDDLVNMGIDAVGDLYPREAVDAASSISGSTKTYDLATDFTNIYRVDIYSSAGTYKFTLPHGIGEGPNSGWELHGGILYLPPSVTFTSGDGLRVFGYARYAQLSVSSQTTDMDATAIWGARAFARMEGFMSLIADRANYQQWQSQTGNTDVTAIAMAQLAANARRDWDRAKQRLRRMRKLG
jgi:hypothetical protein